MELVRSSPGLVVAYNGQRTTAQCRYAAMAGDEVAPERPRLHHLGQSMQFDV